MGHRRDLTEEHIKRMREKIELQKKKLDSKHEQYLAKLQESLRIIDDPTIAQSQINIAKRCLSARVAYVQHIEKCIAKKEFQLITLDNLELRNEMDEDKMGTLLCSKSTEIGDDHDKLEDDLDDMEFNLNALDMSQIDKSAESFETTHDFAQRLCTINTTQELLKSAPCAPFHNPGGGGSASGGTALPAQEPEKKKTPAKYASFSLDY